MTLLISSYNQLFEFVFANFNDSEQKEKLTEVEQQLKKVEAAQRRRLQNEKAARESEVNFCIYSYPELLCLASNQYMENKVVLSKL